MKITLLVEGKTEKVFLPHLRKYLSTHLDKDSMPHIVPFVCDGGIPTKDKLMRTVQTLFTGKSPSDIVIALTDVYTGHKPPLFNDAADAKSKMRAWVGVEPRFHPHAAQYDFEAWLLPYWSTIQKLAIHDRKAPGGNPESVNHEKSPAYHIKEIFRIGKRGDAYIKTRDAARILKDNTLDKAVEQCFELKDLINTILSACGGKTI